MYNNYYGLLSKPFDLSPDPQIVYRSESHKEALAILQYGVIDRKGFLLLTGEVGTGKTTLLNHLVESIDKTIHQCVISNPVLSPDDFYYYLSDQYGFQEYDGNKAKFLLRFSSFINECGENDERVLLIIDEAHVVSVELLEEIRMLANQCQQQFGILSIFLVGQPELNDKLADERFLPLRQRIAIRFHLGQFSEKETEQYILFRLSKAGSQRTDIFSREAIEIIYQESGGTPRLINVVCDQALLLGFAESRPVIDAATVQECVDGIHIPGELTALALPVSEEKTKKLYIGKKIVYTTLFCFFFLGALVIFLYVYRYTAPVHWPGHEQIDQFRNQVENFGENYFGKYF